jgi:hypothetical protein
LSRRSFQVGESAEFSAWWKHAGQFVQPIGDLQSDFGLTFAREIALGLWNELNEHHAEALAEVTDEATDTNEALNRADCLIEDIEACLRNADLEESQKEIKTFLEHYREQNK